MVCLRVVSTLQNNLCLIIWAFNPLLVVGLIVLVSMQPQTRYPHFQSYKAIYLASFKTEEW